MRVTKPKEAHHAFRATADGGGDECLLIKGYTKGRGMYLWVGPQSGTGCTFSGPIGLRALAKAILKEVGTK